MIKLLLPAFCALSLAGQQSPPASLTLAQAKAYALGNNPRIHSADASTRAAGSVVKETHAAQLPSVTGLMTGVEAEHSTILAAGNLQTSSLYSRFASGVAVSQLVTDFGRTAGLTGSARLKRTAQESNARAVRAQVLLEVEQAYFQALGGNAALRAAQAAVANRQIALRQIRALAASSMRSTLDVRFAEVALSQAQLEVVQAENLEAEAQSDLSAALGLDHAQAFTLADETGLATLDAAPDARIAEAMTKRPELQALTQLRDASHRFADAEKRLQMPTVALLGAVGAIPTGDPRLPETYSAAGINITIPILNGGLNSARRAEAEERATAADNDVRQLADQVARDVRNAWLAAGTASRRLDLTAGLLAEANEALRLAQTRYDAGLGGIVELSQAQLNQTSADIQNATARYDYLSRLAALDYATGDLR